MSVRFGLEGGPNTVNRISVNALHLIMTNLFVSLEMFDVLLVYNNYELLEYQLDDMMNLMPMRLYKRNYLI